VVALTSGVRASSDSTGVSAPPVRMTIAYFTRASYALGRVHSKP
jgi:hypothetical protein